MMRSDVMLYASERERRDFRRMRERAVRRSVLARCWQGANAMFNHMALASNRNSFKHLCAQVGKLALANAGMNARRHRSAHLGSTARLARLTQTTGGAKLGREPDLHPQPHEIQTENFFGWLEFFRSGRNRMSMFRKKPVVIDAVQWSGDILDFAAIHEMSDVVPIGINGQNLVVFTLEGQMLASPGDWIIKGVKGEFYPCKPDIFAATYIAIDPDTGDEV